MRALFTYENALPSSQADAEQLVNTAAAFARRGHETVLTSPGMPGTTPEGLFSYFDVEAPLDWRPTRPVPGGYYARHVGHVAAGLRFPRGHFDVVYTRHFVLAALLLSRGHVVTLDHYRLWGDQLPLAQPLLRRVLLDPRCLGATLHSAMAREGYRRLGIPDEKLAVLHNGWEPARLRPRLSRDEARRQLGLALGERLVVYTGRINERKGLDVVLAMADALRTANVRFLLVGGTGEEPIEARAAERPNVTVQPWMSFRDLAPRLFAADVLMVPPSPAPLAIGSTVLPLKLYLYLGAGRAIFAPRSPDTAELLDAQNACLVDPADAADVRDVTQALRSLLGDAGRREALARQALRTADGLTWDARAERLEAFVERRLATVPPRWSGARWAGETAEWLRGVGRGSWLRAPGVAREPPPPHAPPPVPPEGRAAP